MLTPLSDQQAVNGYFDELADKVAKKGSYCYSQLSEKRLVVIRGRDNVEHVACRALRWYEILFAKLGLGRLALFLGFGNADFRKVTQVCQKNNITHNGLISVALRQDPKLKQIPFAIVPEPIRDLPEQDRQFIMLAIKNDFTLKQTKWSSYEKPLILAFQQKLFAAAHFLLEMADDNFTMASQSEECIMSIAYEAGDITLFEKLLKKYGCIDSTQNALKKSILTRACLEGKRDYIDLLVSYKANVHYTTSHSGLETPFSIVCEQGNLELVRKFLTVTEQPVSLTNGISLSRGLERAIFSGHLDIVKELAIKHVEVRIVHVNTAKEKIASASSDEERAKFEQILKALGRAQT